MCWTATTGQGKSAGRARKIWQSARGPPAEAPMATRVEKDIGVSRPPTTVPTGFGSRRCRSLLIPHPADARLHPGPREAKGGPLTPRRLHPNAAARALDDLLHDRQ